MVGSYLADSYGKGTQKAGHGGGGGGGRRGGGGLAPAA